MAELPQNWIESKLEYIVWHKKGSKPKKLYISMQEGYVPYIDIKAFEKNILEQYTEINLAKLTKPNNILVVWDGARAGLVGLAPCIGAIGSTLVDIEPKTKEIINKYLYYFLFSNYAYINSKPRGTGTPHVNPDLYWNMLIPLPPSNEQKRIVEKLDKIIRIVDGVNARLDKIPTALKRARQSILNQAITGELTKDWRKKNAYSSAKELISKLEIEKNNIYAKECEIAKSNETKKPQKPKYFRIANNVLDINIPNQWSFINLSQTIYDFKYGTSTKSDYSYKGIPVIRIPNISNMKLSFDDLKYLNLSDIDSSNKIKKDDILIVRSNGSRDLVGKNALVKELDKEYAFASYLIRMRPLINNPEYLILLLNTDAIKEQFFSKAKSSAGINNINTEELATTIIPLPPLEEQAEIVRRVKLAFEKLDKIELRYQKAKEYSDKLTQSILNKAFRGELVPQDPNDKPIEIEV